MSARLQNLIQRMAAGEMLLCDGAWGTEMQKLGLEPGDCPEEWNLTRPDEVKGIARAYFRAGVDLCLSNTFGGNRYRLVRHGFAGKVREINRAGAALSLQAADEFGGVVAASVGPTGEYVQPEGMLAQAEMYRAFHEQIEALKEGGAEALCIETMYVLDEALLAVKAARDLGMFCMACMTFDQTPAGFRTVQAGTTVEQATKALERAGADVLGTNCGNGITEMVEIARLMRAHTNKPLLVKSNAGLPRYVQGQPVYDETPEKMAAHIRDLHAIGVSIVGGCCGTTPEHIRAFRTAIDALGTRTSVR